jgi:hypothetical protein
MVMPTATITLGELQTFVKRQFGDESGVQIQNTDIARWVNMGSLEVVSKNKIIQATASVMGTAGQPSYSLGDLATDIIAIENITYGTKSLRMTDNSGLKEIIGSYINDSGAPEYWYIWANNIKLWPVPTEAELLSIDYIKSPGKVSSPGDLLPLPDVYYERLCNFVLSKAYELDEDVSNSGAQRKLFEDKLTEMTSLDETRAGSFPIVRDDFYGGYYTSNDEWVY